MSTWYGRGGGGGNAERQRNASLPSRTTPGRLRPPPRRPAAPPPRRAPQPSSQVPAAGLRPREPLEPALEKRALQVRK